jgi:hypothetical protein
MMLDVENLVSDDQSVAIAAGNVLSDYSIDLGAAETDPTGNTPTSDVGRLRNAQMLVQVTTTCDSAEEDATLKVELVMADNAALTSNLVVLQDSGAIAEASLEAGYQFRLNIPLGVTKRYLGCRYTVAVHTLTAGKVTAGIVFDKQANNGYLP